MKTPATALGTTIDDLIRGHEEQASASRTTKAAAKGQEYPDSKELTCEINRLNFAYYVPCFWEDKADGGSKPHKKNIQRKIEKGHSFECPS